MSNPFFLFSHLSTTRFCGFGFDLRPGGPFFGPVLPFRVERPQVGATLLLVAVPVFGPRPDGQPVGQEVLQCPAGRYGGELQRLSNVAGGNRLVAQRLECVAADRRRRVHGDVLDDPQSALARQPDGNESGEQPFEAEADAAGPFGAWMLSISRE